MDDAANYSFVEMIGHAAGRVWHKLHEEGPTSITKLSKAFDDLPRDTVMQAIGWLAREDKVQVEEFKRGRIISLR